MATFLHHNYIMVHFCMGLLPASSLAYNLLKYLGAILLVYSVRNFNYGKLKCRIFKEVPKEVPKYEQTIEIILLVKKNLTPQNFLRVEVNLLSQIF